MKYKRLLWIGFAAMVVVQLFLPASVIIEREMIIQRGKMWKFKTQPVDPNDVFRGKYIYLQFANNELKAPTSYVSEKSSEVYISLVEDEEGFAIPSEIFSELPADSKDHVRVQMTNWTSPSEDLTEENQTIFFEYPFDRFYMEESKAPEAEATYVQATRDSLVQTWAVVYVLNGEAVLTDVIIDGKSVREISQD